jgi:hypothetical protein
LGARATGSPPAEVEAEESMSGGCSGFRTLAPLLAALFGLAATGCATSPKPPVEPPTAEERRAAEAAGFELPPLRDARDLLPPNLLEGPHHAVEETVYTDGTTHVFTIHSDFGTFFARGDDMVASRVHEVQALAALREMSASKEFAMAAGRALASPFVATWNLITKPVDTIVGVPKGAWETVRRTSDLARGQRGELEDSAFREFIGFEAKKRQIAGELDVDPYSSNKALQKELNRFAWAAYAGGLPSMFVPFSKPPPDGEGDPADPGAEHRQREILRQYSPEDLDRLNRIELAVMGVSQPLCDEFIHHPWYSPRHETILVESLSALDLAKNRRAFIEVAVSAASEEDARFYQHTAELMRRYNDDVGRIEKIVAVGGTLTGYAAEGTLVVPFPADHAVWSPSTAAFARSFTEALPDDIEVRKTELLLSGTLSPKARAKIEDLGVEVVDRAFDRLGSRTPESPERDD